MVPGCSASTSTASVSASSYACWHGDGLLPDLLRWPDLLLPHGGGNDEVPCRLPMPVGVGVSTTSFSSPTSVGVVAQCATSVVLDELYWSEEVVEGAAVSKYAHRCHALVGCAELLDGALQHQWHCGGVRLGGAVGVQVTWFCFFVVLGARMPQ